MYPLFTALHSIFIMFSLSEIFKSKFIFFGTIIPSNGLNDAFPEVQSDTFGNLGNVRTPSTAHKSLVWV